MSWADRVSDAYDAESVDPDTDPLAVDVPAEQWADSVRTAHDRLGCSFFDWLSAVDEGDRFRLVCHVAAHRPGLVEHLVLRTLLPREAPTVASVGTVYPGARWHERETHEMFGVDFTEEGSLLELEPLLLTEEVRGHPLRKDFLLAARLAKPWPGAKEPGESDDSMRPSRRRARPPGVPAPEEGRSRG